MNQKEEEALVTGIATAALLCAENLTSFIADDGRAYDVALSGMVFGLARLIDAGAALGGDREEITRIALKGVIDNLNSIPLPSEDVGLN